MQITVSQLQTKHGALVNALKRGEEVELTYHGKILGVVHPVSIDPGASDVAGAMDDFFGMHKDLGADSVEEELRNIRQGRMKRSAL